MGFREVYGLTRSENGWRMVDRDLCVVANPVPHSNTAPVRGGDASVILNAWLIWYHRNVEPIESSVWGWSATNEVASSNHLSGTAVDINAPKYPWGLRVMPDELIKNVRRGLRLFEGSIFWGADWDRADEMHYQLGWPEGDKRNAAFADRLRNGYLGLYVAAGDAEIDKAARLAVGWLGKRISPKPLVCPDRKGRFVQFANGYIYWSGRGKAFAVPMHVFETWAALGWEKGALGYPVRGHTTIKGVGDIQAFQGGVIYRKFGEPGYYVHGRILERFAASGYEVGNGWPVSNERAHDGGRMQRFEKLDMMYHPSTVVRLQKNKVAGKW